MQMETKGSSSWLCPASQAILKILNQKHEHRTLYASLPPLETHSPTLQAFLKAFRYLQLGVKTRSRGFGFGKVTLAWIQTVALSHINCVPLGKLVNFSSLSYLIYKIDVYNLSNRCDAFTGRPDTASSE